MDIFMEKEFDVLLEFDQDVFDAYNDMVYIDILESVGEKFSAARDKFDQIIEMVKEFIKDLIDKMRTFFGDMFRSAAYKEQQKKLKAKLDELGDKIKEAKEKGIQLRKEKVSITDNDAVLKLYEDYADDYMRMVDDIFKKKYRDVNELNEYANKRIEKLNGDYTAKLSNEKMFVIDVNIEEAFDVLRDESGVRKAVDTVKKTASDAAEFIEDSFTDAIENVKKGINSIKSRFVKESDEGDIVAQESLVARAKAKIASMASSDIAKKGKEVAKKIYEHPITRAVEIAFILGGTAAIIMGNNQRRDGIKMMNSADTARQGFDFNPDYDSLTDEQMQRYVDTLYNDDAGRLNEFYGKKLMSGGVKRIGISGALIAARAKYNRNKKNK